MSSKAYRRAGPIGTPTNDSTPKIGNILFALADLKKLGKKPKPTDRGYKLNIGKHIDDGSDKLEYRHVLMDYSDNSQLKSKMMTRRDAFNRNRSLECTGYAWALCSL